MKRSKHSLSHYRLFSCKMGDLVPIGLVEVLPGDSFQHAASLLIRCSPLVTPVMHPVHARVHHWFVPHRLVWENWEAFITGGEDGLDASVYPTITLTYAAGSPPTGNNVVGSLADYLGICPEINNYVVSAIPFRGYALIWNEWYRDQDLQSKLSIAKTDGADATTNTTLQRVAWEKDYFTTSRPWTQKGPQVTIPLLGDALVTGLGIGQTAVETVTPTNVIDPVAGATSYARSYAANTTTGIPIIESNSSGDPIPRADLSQASGVAINDLRVALAIQRYEEARARYGSRYTEYLRYLGVRSSDARLQRPEYLGGGKQTIQFSEVLQTGGDASGDAVGIGNFGGHGIGALRSNRYRRFFEEHGFIFSFVSIQPRTVYAQGVNRHWHRRTKEDFWQRELQHVGQQPIQNQELYAPHSSPEGTFGYQDHYDEYRRMESGVAGQFRTTLLDMWHMARVFSGEPTLNASFIQSNPTDRIFADQTGNDTMYVMANHSIQARRMISRAGTSFTF